MARVGISYQEVVNAIREMQGVNKNPTVDGIRAILQTGSKTTIARYLKEWRQSENIANNSAANALPEELLSLVKGLWQKIQNQADKQVQEIQNEYAVKEKALNEKLTIAYNEIKQYESQIHNLEEHLHTQNNKNTGLMNSLQQTLNEQTKLTERNDALKMRVEAANDEQAKLYEHLKQVQLNLEHYQQAEQQLKEKQLLQIDNINSQHTNKVNKLENELFLAANKTQKLQVELDYLSQKIQEIQQQNSELEKNNKSLNSLKLEYTVLQANYANIEKQISDAKSQLGEYSQKNNKLTIQCEQLLEQKNMLVTRLSQLEDKIEVLREEKSCISQEKANLAGQLSQMQTVIRS